MIREFKNKHSFLSNFFPSPRIYDDMGISYPTVEHYYQAQKTKDVTERIFISELNTPGKAKRHGRQLKLRKDWENIKIRIMKEGLVQKFSMNYFKTKLLETGKEK